MTLISEPSTGSASRVRRRTLEHLTLPSIALAVDAVVLGIATVIATIGRQALGVFDPPAGVSESVQMAAPLILAAWLSSIYLFGGYRNRFLGSGSEEFKRVLNGDLFAVALVGVTCYLTKFSLSRGFFVLLLVIAVPGLLAGRALVRRGLTVARRRGTLAQQVIIAGSPAHVDEVATALHREPGLGYRVVGALTPLPVAHGETATGVPILGDVSRIEEFTEDVDALILAAGSHVSASEVRDLVWRLEAHDVKMIVAPSLSEISSERIRMRPIAGLPLVHLDPPTWSHASRLGKRTFDVVGSLGAILLLSPALVFSAVAIKLNDRGPILYRHQRVGRAGVHFDCLKFRSMVTDADRQIAALQRETGESALLFKMKADPRITRPGRWLRRYSLDELPQLFNVLKGEMSLVGPRPQVDDEVKLYDDAMSRRLRVRPGVTGLWQVSGRSDLTVSEARRLDLYYVDNWSMVQDVAILGRTVGAVLRSRGAY